MTATVGIAERRGSGADARHRRRTARPPDPAAWSAAFGVVLGALLALLARNAMPDDALIHAAYARNLAEHGQWALATGVPANTATSPLWVWLLAAGDLLTGSAVAAIVGWTAVSLGALAVGLHRLAGRWAALLGTTLVATAPVMTSSVGMETFLALALLVWLVERSAAGNWLAGGVVAGLLVLCRPDLAAAAVAAVGVLAVGRPRLLLALPVGGAVTLPWFVWSWVHFGSAWPDTVPLKSAIGGWGTDRQVHLWNAAPYYFERWPAATALTLAVGAVGLVAVAVAVRRRAAPAVALAAGGVGDFVLVAASGGPPAHYYAAPAVLGLGLAAVLVGVRSLLGRAPSVVLALAGLMLVVVHGGKWGSEPPVHTNWATNGEYAAVAAGLPRDGLVMSHGEIGALAFHCMDFGCRVVDDLLADPASTATWVDRWRAAHPWVELNYRFARRPASLPVRWDLDLVKAPTGPERRWPVQFNEDAGGFEVLTRR